VASGEAETMIRGLARLKGIGAELVTVLVWEVSAAERRSLTEAAGGMSG